MKFSLIVESTQSIELHHGSIPNLIAKNWDENAFEDYFIKCLLDNLLKPGTPRSAVSCVDPIPPWVMKAAIFLWSKLEMVVAGKRKKSILRMSTWGIHFVVTKLFSFEAWFMQNSSSGCSYFQMKVTSGKCATVWNERKRIFLDTIRLSTFSIPALFSSDSWKLLTMDPNERSIVFERLFRTSSQY